MISEEYFQSRERFEELHAKNRWLPKECLQNLNDKAQKISLAEILKKFGMEISCNLEFYLKNRQEIENDMNGEKVEFNLNDELSMRNLEVKLLEKQMQRIFGVEEIPDKIEFNDFKLLRHDGNTAYGSMQRGGNYFTFNYQTG